MRESTYLSHKVAVERVIQLIRDKPDKQIDLKEMAKIALSSPYHFNRTFRLFAGIPPSRFLYAVRLERAATLLINTRQSVLDICYAVGYSSLGTFTRRFNELMGISPTRFRSVVNAFRQEHLCDALHYVPHSYEHSSSPRSFQLSGTLTTPASFKGVVLVGLFTTPLPQGKPIACTVAGRGAFSIRAAPKGTYYLFAVGLPTDEAITASLSNPALLRGGGQRVILEKTIAGTTNLVLRPPQPADPPMLITIPLLIRDVLFAMHGNAPGTGTQPMERIL